MVLCYSITETARLVTGWPLISETSET